MHLHPALLRRFPELEGKLPWLSIGELPTLTSRLERLSAHLGVEVYIKRDDLTSALYGGSKVRKLEPLLGEAVQRGARTVVTVGGIGSNHIVAAAVHARSLGLAARAVVFPQPVTPKVRQTLELCLALDVDLVPCPNRLLVPAYLAGARGDAKEDFLIGPGGSSPTGTLGLVAAALELSEQVARGELSEPEEIIVALGSGGTAAGLALGCALAGMATKIIAVRVVERPLANRTLLGILVSRTASLLRRLGARLPSRIAPRIEVVHREFGGRYGRPTEAAEQAVRLFEDLEGISLETTYTGKAAAVLIAPCAAHPRARNPILFWNTHSSADLAPLLALARTAPRQRELPPKIHEWLERPPVR